MIFSNCNMGLGPMTPTTSQTIGGTPVDGVGTGTFAPQAPGVGLGTSSSTLPPRPLSTAPGTGTNDQIPLEEPHLEIDDPKEANPRLNQTMADLQ
uniref:Uncharacterized protein n=1 Tax=Cannabis sativa TaxID=3483 RepID=A0A803NMQ2_CANSA